MADKRYKDYFDIDEHYYASVTADLIAKGLVDWKGFYPHETFVKLIQKTYDVLSGKESKSLWVEGAYGTGKSHAALTLKCLLDASTEAVRAYFDDYGLSSDLCDKLISVKNEEQNGKLITIHRISSSSIRSEQDLIWAIQDSIAQVLDERGIENKAEGTMKEAFLQWLDEKESNRTYLNSLIHEEQYAWNFAGMDVQGVIDRLHSSDEMQIAALMRNLITVADDNGIMALRMDAQKLASWIRNLILVNNLNAIVFVWDEFTEFFTNNSNSLTGFQTIAEVSESNPFYFVIICHQSRDLFTDTTTAKKILDRFVTPIEIKLPENMAFKLMAQAMKLTSDTVSAKEWMNEYKPALNDQLILVRKSIEDSASKSRKLGEKTVISDDELKGIVPIHPYAALLLKHMSVIFNSNQRSMFDFIISNDITDAKGFKWYIQNHGPLDDAENLLTIDMLWDFFYGKGQNGLNQDVRNILDNYSQLQSSKLIVDQQRVLKTVLLLQAICMRATDADLLRPNIENIDLAFAGTDWVKGKAANIAKGLCSQGLLFEKPVGGGKKEFTVAMNTGDSNAIEKAKLDVRNNLRTADLVEKANLMNALTLRENLAERYHMEVVQAVSNTFMTNVIKLNGWAEEHPFNFTIVVCFALSDEEQADAKRYIEQAIACGKSPSVMFLDATLVPMGKDLTNQYVENMAYSTYYAKKNNDQAKHFNNEAVRNLSQWQQNITTGAFRLYSKKYPNGLRLANYEAVQNEFANINYQKFPYGLEQYNVVGNMFKKGPLAQGAECGLKEIEEKTFSSSNIKTKLSTALNGVWKVEKYWEVPANQSLVIVKIKKEVDSLIQSAFKEKGQIGMADIFARLQNEPYGFTACNIVAFVMGFVLKEYATNDFFWSNLSNSYPMTLNRMKEMIANTINQTVTFQKNYKQEFIVVMSWEMRTFLNHTAEIFDIPSEQCGSIAQARDQIRNQMKKLIFPIWCVKSILPKEILVSTPKAVIDVIDKYCGIANIGNVNNSSESDLANEIGQMMMTDPAIVEDLKTLLISEKCKAGMMAYIGTFQNGILLKLASSIGDNGAYLDEVKNKFNADAANWVWRSATADSKINEVIMEYQIVEESNRSLPKSTSLSDTILEWNQKTNNIRISYEAVNKSVGDLGKFLGMLYSMKQSRTWIDQHRQAFYTLLLEQRESFESFYRNQTSYFKQVAGVFLEGLNDEDINKLYTELPSGQFTKSKTEYFQFVEKSVKSYVQNQSKQKLKSLWKMKTETKDPKYWSNLYETPILCMFDDNERAVARDMFSILFENSPSEVNIGKATKYLESADFYMRLSDSNERDRCFKEHVIGKYEVMLSDVKEVRDYLISHTTGDTYYWIDNSSIQNQLEMLADKKYKVGGCDRALKVIDEMKPADLRKYLRELISGSLTVGMEIIKNKKVV
jgi:hypothetical protein